MFKLIQNTLLMLSISAATVFSTNALELENQENKSLKRKADNVVLRTLYNSDFAFKKARKELNNKNFATNEEEFAAKNILLSNYQANLKSKLLRLACASHALDKASSDLLKSVFRMQKPEVEIDFEKIGKNSVKLAQEMLAKPQDFTFAYFDRDAFINKTLPNVNLARQMLAKPQDFTFAYFDRDAFIREYLPAHELVGTYLQKKETLEEIIAPALSSTSNDEYGLLADMNSCDNTPENPAGRKRLFENKKNQFSNEQQEQENINAAENLMTVVSFTLDMSPEMKVQGFTFEGGSIKLRMEMPKGTDISSLQLKRSTSASASQQMCYGRLGRSESGSLSTLVRSQSGSGIVAY
ncbi:MAG: hypothetical protein Q8S21_06565 [Candidatus Paracaedibacteraceae bacterium]|nr:hypothetical protein [Candidatus Paracaedibacteraceae bacterium]